MPTLYLIDGYAQFFRAYHAIRTPMTSPVTKEPTNMTFGFVGMLLKLLRGEGAVMTALGGKPDYVAVTLDVSSDRGTFRSQIDAEYKANRPPPPEDLGPQVDRCLAMLREIGMPIVGCEGFEADDCLATLVTQLSASHPELAIRIISKDKDLKQLLRPSTVALFDIHTDQAYGTEELLRDTGLAPAQVIDMLALMGDSVDNVPGVEGVGEKTAAQLIGEFGSLDTLIARAGEIKGKRGERIREAISQLAISRQLVALRHDVPCDFDLNAARASALKLDRLIPVLKELGFNRYQDEVRALLGASNSFMPPLTAANAPREPYAAPESPKKPPPRRATSISPEATLFAFADRDAVHGDASATDTSSAGPSGEYRCITTRDELAGVIKQLCAADLIALDTETTGTRPMLDQLCGVSLSIRQGQGWYIPVRSPTPERHLDEPAALTALKPVLEDPAIKKTGHNLKFDLLILRNTGVRVAGAAFDSMVTSYLIDASRSSHGLEALSLALLSNPKNSITELIGSGKDQRSFETVPIADATRYAAADADLTLQLHGVMAPQIQTMGLGDLFERVEMPLVEVLAELEYNGVLVDGAELDRQRARLVQQIETILAKLNRESMASIGRKFDPDSPKQLAAMLFNKPEDELPGLGLKPIKRTKTGFSTDAEVLDTLAEDATLATPIPKLILEYRQLSKLVSTYLVALKDEINPRTGRVHTSFNQTVAATGRLASSDPNLQNIPIRSDVGREIRKAFVAPPGCVLITADYSQIELRLLAHLSRDPALIEAFRTDQDIHTQVAAQIHGVPIDQVSREQRSGAKMVNFGIVYGITAYGLARRLGIENDAADQIIKGYKKRFAGISTFLEECVDQARRFGYVETILKRRRPIPEIESTNPSRRAFAERTAINSVVQGSAADLIKLAMVEIFQEGTEGRRHRGTKGQGGPRGLKMLLQIHDELVFECPAADAQAAAAWVKAQMEGAMTLSVPLKVDVHAGKNWFEGK
jgi:DNA polymerase I